MGLMVDGLDEPMPATMCILKSAALTRTRAHVVSMQFGKSPNGSTLYALLVAAQALFGTTGLLFLHLWTAVFHVWKVPELLSS